LEVYGKARLKSIVRGQKHKLGLEQARQEEREMGKKKETCLEEEKKTSRGVLVGWLDLKLVLHGRLFGRESHSHSSKSRLTRFREAGDDSQIGRVEPSGEKEIPNQGSAI
jgi:hypothetical protein